MSSTPQTKENLEYKIEFDQPKRRLPHETRSKFLLPSSELYFFIKDCQDRIKYKGWRITDRLEPCIEILAVNETAKKNELDVYLRRVAQLESTSICVNDRSKWVVANKRLYYVIGEVEKKVMQIQVAAFQTALINKERFLNIIFDENFNYGGDWDDSGAATA
jgi:hypothetical protein